MARVFNFNAGPAALPLDVLKEIHEEWFDFAGTGESILEISHRSPAFLSVIETARQDTLDLLGLDDSYTALFTSGGANLQFAQVPLNFLTPGKKAAYVLTSYFSDKALKEAKKIGDTEVVWQPDGEYRRAPKPNEIPLPKDAAYLHVTTNGTAEGVEFQDFPDTGTVPLIGDMTSDLMARTFDARKFTLFYAGVQKNIGPAGTVLVVAKKDFLKKRRANLPDVLDYELLEEKDSIYNTPPVFQIYAVGKVLQWMKRNGGLTAAEERNRQKSELIYDVIDEHPAFYQGYAEKDSRSIVSVVFRLPSKELDADFVHEAEKRNLFGLKGHRIIGGIRASLYNGVPLEAAKALAEFMEGFYKSHR